MNQKLKLTDLTLKDALDLAILVEEEAHHRYLEFERQIGASNEYDAGSFFLKMAENESKHAEELRKKRVELFGNEKSRIDLESMYQFQEIEAPEFDYAQSFMSVKDALLVAKNCEIKAFEFFEKAANLVTDKEVKDLFNHLKEEEIEHRKMVEEIISKIKTESGPTISKEDIDEPNGL